MELSLGEIVTVLGTIVGFGWGLLQLSFKQFEKRQDEKFEALRTSLNEQNKKFSMVEVLALDVKKLEIEIVKRDGEYARLYINKDDFASFRNEMKQGLNELFALTRAIDTKLDGKIDRQECTARMRDCT